MEHRAGIYEKYIKRLLDIVLSLCAIIVLSPLMLIIAILVRIKLGRQVIFCQERPGKIDKKTGKEKIFKMYKFRSMTDERDENGELMPNEIRLTNFGKKLRATSLDELPELFNILKGDMSIVGPRPLLVEYLPYYTDEEKHNYTKEYMLNITNESSLMVYEHDIRENNIKMAFKELAYSPYFYILIIIYIYLGGGALW